MNRCVFRVGVAAIPALAFLTGFADAADVDIRVVPQQTPPPAVVQPAPAQTPPVVIQPAPAPPVVVQPAPAPSVTAQPGTPVPPGSVIVTPGSSQVLVPPTSPTTLQADDIRANQVRAQTIYANKITARDVQGLVHQTDNVKIGGGKDDVKA